MIDPGIVDDHRLGLMFPDGGIESILLPVRIGLGPIAVEPEPSDFAVVATKYLHALA